MWTQCSSKHDSTRDRHLSPYPMKHILRVFLDRWWQTEWASGHSTTLLERFLFSTWFVGLTGGVCNWQEITQICISIIYRISRCWWTIADKSWDIRLLAYERVQSDSKGQAGLTYHYWFCSLSNGLTVFCAEWDRKLALFELPYRKPCQAKILSFTATPTAFSINPN